jgi:hypothetical protein
MRTAINDLVNMRDIVSLIEIMNEGEDWMDQIDAAEGLIQLGDRRGLEYLLVARQSDIEDISDSAKETLADPEVKHMREQIEAEQRFASQKLVEGARGRLKNGKKVFLHKVIYLPAGEFLQEDENGAGFRFYELNDAGLEGWEVVNILPRRHLVSRVDNHFVGAYVFLKKELGPDEAAELEKA